MNDQLKELLRKLPLVPLLAAYGAYLGYDYYSFMNDPASPLNQKKASLVQVQQANTVISDKLKKANEFFRTLEQRRSQLRTFAIQLEEAKASLSDQIDVSAFVRMVIGEAKKVGLNVVGIRPTDSHQQEYYVEQSFELKFKGVFVQLVVFMERLANLDRIVRIGDFTFKPSVVASSRFVSLEGVMQLNAYRYRDSRADELVKENPSSPSTSGGSGTSSSTSGGTATSSASTMTTTTRTTTSPAQPATQSTTGAPSSAATARPAAPVAAPPARTTAPTAVTPAPKTSSPSQVPPAQGGAK